MKILLSAGLLACSFTVLAQTAPDASQRERETQRERINRERTQFERAFDAEEAICYQKFFTNACLDEVKPRRRDAMANLKRQEILLNETERRMKAAEQVARTEEKLSEERRQQESAARQKALGELSGRVDRTDKKAADLAAEDANAAKRAQDAAQKEKQALEKQKAAAGRDQEAAARAEKTRKRQQEAARKRAEQERAQAAKRKPDDKPLPPAP
ncbi:MAG: hypothetical protein V4731_18185 [Pseudomonadota bacterium]